MKVTLRVRHVFQTDDPVQRRRNVIARLTSLLHAHLQTHPEGREPHLAADRHLLPPFHRGQE